MRSLDSLDPMLLAKLPPDVTAHLERALETPSDKPGFRSKHVIEACRAASFPSARVYPLASELSEAHRALAELLAREEHYNGFGAAMPKTAAARRRWLGIDRPSVLEEPVSGGDGEPLWRCLQRLVPEESEGRMGAQRASEYLATLPFDQRLQYMLADRAAYGLDEVVAMPTVDELVSHGGELPRIADLTLALPDRAIYFGPSRTLASRVFLALVRARLPIDPRWDALFPTRLGSSVVDVIEAARALPEPRRSAALVAALTRDRYGDEATFVILSQLPSVAPALVPFVLGEDCWGSLPVPKRIRRLKELGKAHAEVSAALDAAVEGRPAVQALSVTKQASPVLWTQLSSRQSEQLRAAIKAYGQTEEWQLEPSHWYLTIHEVSGSRGELLYEVFDIMADSGTVFRAGTCQEVAAIIQGGVQCDEQGLAEALATALHDARNAKKAPTTDTAGKPMATKKAAKPKPMATKKAAKPKPTATKKAAKPTATATKKAAKPTATKKAAKPMARR